MIGERLAKLRTEHNMTQESFAEQLEVSRQAVSKWELDKTLPDVNKLLKMSEMFGVSVDYILKGDDGLSDGMDKEIAVTHELDGIDIDGQMNEQEAPCKSDVAEAEAQKDEAEKNVGAKDETEKNEAQKEKTEKDEEVTGVETIKANKGKTGNRTAIAVSAVIVGILLLAVVVFAVFGMTSKAWDKRSNHETLARVEKIHGQYSLADVSSYTEDKGTTTKTVFLDTKGVKEGDYVYCYVDSQNKKISVDYSTAFVSVVVTLLVLLLFVWILLIRSLKKDE
ncbi:MAG: helix-turn-helix domain-containing protein [Clostridium sp.]|nr:helix-turn-helix domain-containing protein [Clostridium sp.]MCM1208178.1 helix-turn-helix domain-containing protein [Ruminococcus sp.]